MRFLSLESRRATETAELIRRAGGDPFVAPSMREVPMERNEKAFHFGEKLLTGDYEMVILMTGVGTRYLMRLLDTRFDPVALREALSRTTLVARGSKPSAALRELGLSPSLIAPEPNTWREVLSVTANHQAKNIAVQEYGKPSEQMYHELRLRGAHVTPVPVYQWELPEDLGPLHEAIRRLVAGEFDVVLFTAATQVTHLLQVAGDEGVEGKVHAALSRAVIGSIGPTTSETIREVGLEPSFEPSHPKLGILVKEAIERAPGLIAARE